MKIAVWNNLPSGGGKRALYHHVKGLVARGHHVEVWCPPSADDKYLRLSELCDEHRVPLVPHYALGYVANRIPWRYRKLTAELDAMEVHCRSCAEEISRGRFDVLFANTCMSFAAAGIGLALPELPSVMYLQEPYRDLYEARPHLPWEALPPRLDDESRFRYAIRWVRNLVEVQGLRYQLRQERIHMKAFGRLLVNSQFSRESVRRAYNLDSEVCYLGVDADMFRPLGLERDRFAISVGAFHRGKGAETAIRAIGAVPSKIRPRLVWIGNSANKTYQKDMVQLAESLNVQLEIKVLVPHGELVDWLNRASFMIYSPLLEPFGLAPLEANACETPVVAVAEGGVRETIMSGQNGILVGSCRPEPLAEAIIRLLAHPDEARVMGQRGREWVLAKWTWEQAITRLEQHLEAAASDFQRRSGNPFQ